MQFPGWLPNRSRRGENRLFQPLTAPEKKAFRLHMISAILGGISVGVIINHEYIAVNGLNAVQWQVTALTMLWPISNILSVFINHWIDSHGRYDRAVLLVGVLTRLPIALMFFFSSVNVMLLLLLLFFASNSVILPAQNAVMKSRYGDSNRARLFGWWSSVLTLFSLPMAMLAGALLDADFQFYRLLFVIEAVFGAGQAVFLSLMARGMSSSVAEKSTGRGSKHFLRSLWSVFRRDREFAWFETYFFLYGVAFLMLLPVIPYFATDVLDLDYEQYAVAKGVIGQLGVLLLSPFMGIRLSRIHPFRFTGIVSIILAFYPLSLAAGAMVPSLGTFFFYLAFFIFAIGMAGIRVSWSISSMHFAPPGQEATYQGLHISLTALRACFAPILGSVLLHYFGYSEAFLVAAGVFSLAGVLFILRYRSHHARDRSAA